MRSFLLCVITVLFCLQLLFEAIRICLRTVAMASIGRGLPDLAAATKVWRDFAERHMQPAQIDAVDIAAIERLLPEGAAAGVS